MTLPNILKSVVRIAEWGMAGPVEMEFACNLTMNPPELVLLQLRPMLSPMNGGIGLEFDSGKTLNEMMQDIPHNRILARAGIALG